MDNIFIYLLQSSLCLTVFLLFYLLFLKKETFYFGNRLFLITTGCFSVFMPLLKIGWPVTGYAKELTYFMSPVFITKNNKPGLPDSYLYSIPEIIYLLVVAFLLLNFIFRLIRISLLIKKSKSILLKGQKVLILEKGSAPFSFLNAIFLPRDQISDTSVDSIIAHEKMHICQFHSFDMILFEIIKIIHWFNPFAWKFKKEIEAQNEFFADSGLISGGIDFNQYKNVLVANSFGTCGSTITNNFNSLLKRRLEMISKQKSGVFGKVKLFLTLPLMAFLIMLIGVVNGNSSFANSTGDKNKEKVYKNCDQMPSYTGGQEEMIKFISSNIGYPEIAKKGGIQGKVFVQFVVDKDGSVTDVKVAKGIGAGCDEEAVRVVKLMPKWVPGKDKGKVVKVKISLPIAFKLK